MGLSGTVGTEVPSPPVHLSGGPGQPVLGDRQPGPGAALPDLGGGVLVKRGQLTRPSLGGSREVGGCFASLNRGRLLSYCVVHSLKAGPLNYVVYSPRNDLAPPARLEGSPQMHQATDGGFPPKCPRRLEAQITHPPHCTLD